MTIDIDQNLKTRLELTFRKLNTVAAASSMPPPTSLARALEDVATKLEKAHPNSKDDLQISVNPNISTWFTTAAIEIWQRAVHSFLISASLTDVSPIWASVSGYYSSHYSVRALAHLLGYFQLFQFKRIVQLDMQAGGFICTFIRKDGGDREHHFYWRVVNKNPYFNSDPLFILNNGPQDASDSGHREKSNYSDHISGFPQFRPLDAQLVQDRIHHISQISFTAPPIPRRSKFPDVDSVQIVAYHRIVRFRGFVDEIAGGSNRFWSVNRNPSWSRDFINFQLTEQGIQ